MTSAPFSLCLEATYLAFEGKVYRQIHGTAMGSRVSVVVANLVMEDVEQKALSTFHTPPRFWRRYVDDTCTALPSNLADSFHDHLNSIDPCMQFTIERESDDQLPFLDILLNREEDGSISTSVYRKATHPHRSVSVLSLPLPCSPQTSCGEDTECRAEAFSSSGVSRVQEEKLVSQALQGNGYPKGFIHKRTCPQPDQRTPRDQVAGGSVTLPYIRGLSESIRRVLGPPSHPGYLPSLQDPEAGACAPHGPSTSQS